jgi:hypothetical protein
MTHTHAVVLQGVILDCNATAHRSEYPITPTGHITHINGYTQLVLYPKADPTLEHCIDYRELTLSQTHLHACVTLCKFDWHAFHAVPTKLLEFLL